ncbi:MAG TPA: hypothetical protein V6C88_04670 [Chroococcidiopsis sp.]
MTESPPPNEFLTPDECVLVDSAMMTSRDRFSARVAIYSLRSLKQIAQETGQAIASLQPQQIADWIAQDPSLQPEKGFDSGFKSFFSQLVISAIRPLSQMSAANQRTIEDLTVQDVIVWFEKEAKRRIEQGSDAPC